MSADFTGEGWRTMLGFLDAPVMEPDQAGRMLGKLAKEYDFSLFEYWASDYAGHGQEMDTAVRLMDDFWAPRIETIKIDPEKIGAVIGKGGETIRGMQEEFEAEIDIDDDGSVRVESGQDASLQSVKATCEMAFGMLCQALRMYQDVVVKNENDILPLSKDTPVIFIAGEGANDIGLQSGGWTLEWLGKPGNDNEGTTVLSGIRATAGAKTRVEYNSEGDFSEFNDSAGNPLIANVGIAVLAEQPYAEGVGDRADISLNEAETSLIVEMGKQSETVVVILLSGRPRVITKQFPLADAWVAAWLPGTEGGGIADVLFGDYAFTGKLPYSWPRSNEQLPININNSADKTGCDAPLFPFGYGLEYGAPSPEIEPCEG